MMILTMKCQVKADESLKETIRLGNVVCQETIDKGFFMKTFNKNKLNRAIYRDMRNRYPMFNSSYIQTVRDQASDMLKRLKLKKRPIKKEYSSIRLDGRNFKVFLESKILNISTINGRKKYPIKIPKYFTEKYEFGRIKAGTIAYQKGKFLLNINVEVECKSKIESSNVIGIDRGIYYPVVTSNNHFFDSKRLRCVKGKYLHLRGVLQSVGTHSAKRKLKRLAGRERRFVTDVNHCISKKIVNMSFDTFVVEKLEIRRRKRNGRRFNKLFGQWSPAQLLFFIQYKSEFAGKNVVSVPANYTSQACSKCGFIHRANRIGRLFNCSKCGFRLHSDLNASRNIAFLGSARLGRLSVNQPIVACDDAKASLKDELRRSIVTSPAF